MKTIVFRYWGKVGHFLKAEANRTATTYPVPSRTVLLGLLGAILGLAKDEPQRSLKDAYLGLSAKIPHTHWHTVKLRKDPPVPLPQIVKATAKSSKTSAPEKPALIRQEWLWQPDYVVYAALSEPYHEELLSRLKARRWYFTPCLGLSEMIADLSLIDNGEYEAIPLQFGKHQVNTLVRQESGRLDTESAFHNGLALQSLRMPRTLTEDRVFTHASYYLERNANLIPFETGEAWKIGNQIIIFL